MDDVVITFLGSGAAIPPPDRFQSSIALKHPHGLVIFDVGEGSQFNLRKFKIPVRKEITIAISHPHADHYQGLAGLIASFNMLDRKEPISILVPEGFADFLKLLLHACQVQTEFELNFVEMQPGGVFEGKGYQIVAERALHFKHALSYKWQEDDRPGKWDKDLIAKYDLSNKQRAAIAKGKSIQVSDGELTPADIIGPPRRGRVVVYSGDTKFNPQLSQFAKFADVLIHEATYPSDMELESAEREHSTVSEAAKIGQLAEVGIVLLTHIGTRLLNFKQEKLLAKQIHPSKIVYDGFKYTLPFQN